MGLSDKIYSNMRKICFFILILFLVGVSCDSGNGELKHNCLDPEIESKIDNIISELTLEEKIGQMSQFTIDLIGKGGNAYYSDEPFEIDPAMLDTVIGKYKVGSILNTSNNRARTTEVWENSIRLIQERALQETGIPVIYGIDEIGRASCRERVY